jgi:hypothetical protein
MSFICHVGICEIDVQQHVIFVNRRTEQQRLLPIDGQLETGQEPGPFMVKALRSLPETADVTVSAKDAEGIALL